MMSDVTSSIRRAHARYGLSAAMRKRDGSAVEILRDLFRLAGAPLSVPAAGGPES